MKSREEGLDSGEKEFLTEFKKTRKNGYPRICRKYNFHLWHPCGILQAARRAMEMERIWRQYPEDDAGWMSM